MKCYSYTLFLFIILSGVTFGQDSINNATLLQGLILQNISGTPGAPGTNPILIKQRSTYILNQQEKDSVWNSIYTDSITQNLLAYDPHLKSDWWYRPEHTQNLMAVLNLGTLSHRQKSEIVIRKMFVDNEREFVPYYGFRCGRPPHRTSIQYIYSKEIALRDYMNIIQNPTVNFSKSINNIISFDVDFSLEQPLISAKTFKNTPSSLRKTARMIRKTKITRIEFGGIENYPPNSLLIYQERK